MDDLPTEGWAEEAAPASSADGDPSQGNPCTLNMATITGELDEKNSVTAGFARDKQVFISQVVRIADPAAKVKAIGAAWEGCPERTPVGEGDAGGAFELKPYVGSTPADAACRDATIWIGSQGVSGDICFVAKGDYLFMAWSMAPQATQLETSEFEQLMAAQAAKIK